MLRLYRLGSVPFRGDEAFTVQNWMLLPLSQSLTHIATLEPHPLLTYVIFRMWGLIAGATEFSARFLPVLVNTLGIPAVYALGKRVLNHRVGVLAAFFWAVHPYLIWHSQDARNYAIWSGLSVLVLWLGLRAVERNRKLDWILYGVIGVITANVFYFEMFFVFALTFYALTTCWGNWQLIRRFLSVQFLIVIFPVLFFLLFQGKLIATGTYGGTTGGGLEVLRLFTWFLPTLFWGETLSSEWSSILGFIILVVLLVAGIVIWRVNRKSFKFLFSIAFIPVMMLSVLSLKFDIFNPRYILGVVPGFILLFSIVIVFLPSVLPRFPFLRLVSVLVCLLWTAIAGLTLYNYCCVNDYAKSKDWPSLTKYLEARVTAKDIVLQLSVDPAFGYYYQAPARDEGLPANPKQTVTEIEQKLDQFSQDYQSIWLVGHTFPDWPNYGVVENWLQNHLQLVRETSVSNMPVRQYMPWEAQTNSVSSLANFGAIVELMDFEIFPAEPTGDITIWIYWRPISTTNTPYKVFLHLVGGMNPATGTSLWSQDDQFPQNGRISTNTWASAAIYRDIYTLPVQAVPSGLYEVRLGLYNPDTGERLHLPNNDDSYLIQTLKLP